MPLRTPLYFQGNMLYMLYRRPAGNALADALVFPREYVIYVIPAPGRYGPCGRPCISKGICYICYTGARQVWPLRTPLYFQGNMLYMLYRRPAGMALADALVFPREYVIYVIPAPGRYGPCGCPCISKGVCYICYTGARQLWPLRTPLYFQGSMLYMLYRRPAGMALADALVFPREYVIY